MKKMSLTNLKVISFTTQITNQSDLYGGTGNDGSGGATLVGASCIEDIHETRGYCSRNRMCSPVS